jgi:MerR family transcriptional regulator, light-induced transcriptional regulator
LTSKRGGIYWSNWEKYEIIVIHFEFKVSNMDPTAVFACTYFEVPMAHSADSSEASGASNLAAAARLRSGTAARLAGVPVATLRVWERRYGVVAAPKTPTGQRLYSSHDVQRLRLIKQLADGGHAIGTIATLALGELDLLSADLGNAPRAPRAPHAPASAAGRHVLVIGRAAGQKLGTLPGCASLTVLDDLEHAEALAAQPSAAADVLLAHLPSLQPAAAERVLALAARLGAATVIVLYAFGAQALAESLRAAGVLVRREPLSGRELARLIAATPPTAAAQAEPRGAARRYSDEALAHLAELPTTVACECPRHIAELVMQLAAFERYSTECSARTPADAALHRHLTGIAGVARTMFEQALERVIADEGLVLPIPATA